MSKILKDLSDLKNLKIEMELEDKNHFENNRIEELNDFERRIIDGRNSSIYDDHGFYTDNL